MEYLLFTDETNQQPSPINKFFIYGGVFIPNDKLLDLHNLVIRARENNGFQPTDQFKFDTHSKPDHISSHEHAAAKDAVLDGSVKLGVRFTAYAVLHDIAKNRRSETLIKWGADAIFSAFNRFLEKENKYGICVIDRVSFKGKYQYLQEKFQKGLKFSGGGSLSLSRILSYSFSCQGASHAASAIDIILGAFRYCVNERRPSDITKKLFSRVIRMMWHRRDGDRVYLREYGLLLRPKDIGRYPPYKPKYEELTEHLKRLLQTLD